MLEQYQAIEQCAEFCDVNCRPFVLVSQKKYAKW